ncbi:MAG: FecR domain-containing protein [Tannerellaceae bacterium]|nr:FecR domain-containing protein [Tannerellaceae bacterium]
MEENNKHINRISRRLIGFFRSNPVMDSQEEMDLGWEKIRQRVRQQRQIKGRRRIYLYATVAAAMLTGVILYLSFLHTPQPEKSVLYELASLWKQEEEPEDILLVAAEEQIILPSDTVVTYSNEGRLDEHTETAPEQVYDQVIVPKGKRVRIILSDQTKMWVNAGTRVIYPRIFSGKTREIYTDGEIFLEVTPDKEKPFIVRTNNFEVEVKGTSFNVCAYKEFSQSVVLVEGSVDVTHTGGAHVLLQPGQLLSVQADKLGEPKRVNTDDYVSWIHNLLVLREEPLQTVLRKLHLYYGTEFVLQGAVEEITVSGKLDLQNDIMDVIRSIADTAPVRYTTQGEKIIIESI